MQAKVVRGSSERGWGDFDSYKKTEDEDGIQITLLGSKTTTINIPEDGDSVYLMNDQGQNVDSYHWPPRHSRFRVAR